MLLLILAGSLACTSGAGDSGSDGATGSSGESGIASLRVSDVVGTVADVEIAMVETATTVWVEVTADTAPVLTFPATGSGNNWTTQLRGLKPGTDYIAQLFVDARLYDQRPFTTGSPPGALPGLSATGDGSAQQYDGLVLTSIMTEPSHAVIVDAEGDLLWWHQSPYAGHLITRAHLSADGSGVTYISKTNAADGGEGQPTYLVRVPWNGQDVTAFELDQGHHDFVELDDGTVLYVATDPITVDGEGFRGDKVIERAPDGTEHTVWSVWDSFDADPELEKTAGTGFSHANSIDLDPATGTVLLGMRNFDAIVALDRATGAMLWQLGGAASDFSVPDADQFHSQHQYQWLDGDRLLVFDNGTTDRFASRAIEYQLDLDAWTASAVWQHETDPPIYCYGPGDVWRLDSGDSLVTWGSSGLIDQVSAEGELRWSLIGSVGGAFGYVTPLQTF